jgi:membrane-bound lytic murein transglycosylase A
VRFALRVLSFARLRGWSADDHDAALACYARTMDALPPDWPRADGRDARAFFESAFVPVDLGQGPTLFTGYYEPELNGAAERGGRFQYALYGPPSGLAAGMPWHSRAKIEDGNLLAGQEIVWLDDVLDAFLAQVQGSVRIHLADGGGTVRLGYAGKNGHPYRSIGAELVRRGEIPAETVSILAIRRWCAAHPDQITGLLRHNPSYVFFRTLDLDRDLGPIGTLDQPVTAGRTLAVDPDHYPLGAPIWAATFDAHIGCRLMVAQDTGSAIRGPGRADVFCGTGAAAGVAAGDLRVEGTMTLLLPRVMMNRQAE